MFPSSRILSPPSPCSVAIRHRANPPPLLMRLPQVSAVWGWPLKMTIPTTTASLRSRRPRNAMPLHCAISKRSNGNTRRCGKDCSEVPRALRRVRHLHGVPHHPSKMKAAAKERTVAMGGITTGIRGMDLQHRPSPGNYITRTLLRGQTQASAREMTSNPHVSRTGTREVQTLAEEVASEEIEARKQLERWLNLTNPSSRQGLGGFWLQRQAATRSPRGYAAARAWMSSKKPRDTVIAQSSHGRPLPELIAFATCDVLGRFSDQTLADGTRPTSKGNLRAYRS